MGRPSSERAGPHRETLRPNTSADLPIRVLKTGQASKRQDGTGHLPLPSQARVQAADKLAIAALQVASRHAPTRRVSLALVH